MQFRDLPKQYDVLKDKIDAAMIEVASSAHFISGPEVKELEKALAEYVGVKHCITCANGTDAITIAMRAWGVGKGDAVFVPDFTFFSSGECPADEGATPIYVDVDQRTYNINPVKLEEAVKKVITEGKYKAKAVVAVDLFGLPADYPAIKAICEKYDLLLLEDGAQGFGGSINGKLACSFGDISTTSFFPAKPLGCYGDGGAVFTDDDEIASLVQSIRVHGKGTMKYDNVRLGLNSRLDSIQAAILQVKFRAFEDYELVDVNKAAGKYTESLSRELGEKVVLPLIPEGFLSSWAQYTIQLKDKETRDAVQAALKEKGIPSMVYYPKPMHCQEAFGIVGEYGFDCRNTEELCDTVLSLPMHPYMTDDEIREVVEALAENIG